jgi:outer membrane scaffolding protein for murein synthesis (MipA/OmpV family)
MEPDKLSRGLAVGPSAQRYSKSATATIPIVFQHGDNQIARQAAGPSYLRIAKRAATL